MRNGWRFYFRVSWQRWKNSDDRWCLTLTTPLFGLFVKWRYPDMARTVFVNEIVWGCIPARWSLRVQNGDLLYRKNFMWSRFQGYVEDCR